jgi:predicted ATPase with chaperone activity
MITISCDLGNTMGSTTIERREVTRAAFLSCGPHHTISDVGLIDSGQLPLLGDVSLAHHGMRLVDELPEFRPHVLEVLRQPFENGLAKLPPLGCSQPRCAGRMSSAGAVRLG